MTTKINAAQRLMATVMSKEEAYKLVISATGIKPATEKPYASDNHYVAYLLKIPSATAALAHAAKFFGKKATVKDIESGTVKAIAHSWTLPDNMVFSVTEALDTKTKKTKYIARVTETYGKSSYA